MWSRLEARWSGRNSNSIILIMLNKIVKTNLSIIIVLLILFFTGYNTIAGLSDSIAEDTSVFSLFRDQFCVPRLQDPILRGNDKLVVLRLDDVQAFSWRDTSLRMIRDAYSFNAPIVAGVIPNALYLDQKLVQFLRRESCNFEIALHGWDHTGATRDASPFMYITEFWNIDYDNARKRVRMGLESLQPLTQKPIISFIPPYNIISTEGLRGIYDEWIQINSSLWFGPYDYHSSTYNFDQKRIVDIDEVVSNCKTAFDTIWLCVIMMHPQDYSWADKIIDEDLYKTYYIEMLNRLTDMGVVFVTFRDVVHKNNETIRL